MTDPTPGSVLSGQRGPGRWRRTLSGAGCLAWRWRLTCRLARAGRQAQQPFDRRRRPVGAASTSC